MPCSGWGSSSQRGTRRRGPCTIAARRIPENLEKRIHADARGFCVRPWDRRRLGCELTHRVIGVFFKVLACAEVFKNIKWCVVTTGGTIRTSLVALGTLVLEHVYGE